MAAPEMIPPALALDPAYADEVRKLSPWGYWRFETEAVRLIPNEMPGRPPLRANGPLELAGVPGENHSAVFGAGKDEQYLVMDDSWTPPRLRGYAVEVGGLSEEFNASTLVGLTSRADEPARSMYIPYRWHHVVIQEVRDRLKLYLDGERAGDAQADPDERTTACRLLVGRLKTDRQPNIYQVRPFVGRLDELAVYDHPLSPETIRHHYELGTASRPLLR